MFSEEFRSKIIKVSFMNPFSYQPNLSLHGFIFILVFVMTLCLIVEIRNSVLYRSVLFFIFIVIINGFILYHLVFIFPRCNENRNGGRESVEEDGAFFQKSVSSVIIIYYRHCLCVI